MPTKRGDFAMAYMNNLAVCAGGLGKGKTYTRSCKLHCRT